MNIKRIVHGALLLTVAGLLSKILSALYRIPLQNLTGDIGFYIYQQVYPFIATVMILTLYGFPAAIAKLTAEAMHEQTPLTMKTFYGPILFILTVVNGSFFLLFYLSAPMIAQFIGDIHLTASYRLFGSLFLFIPLLALLRGLYQGMEKMHYVALSQVIEQVVRVGSIVTVAYFVYMEYLPLYRISEYGVVASIVGMALATLLLLIVWRSNNRHIQHKSFYIPWRNYIGTLVSYGMIASFIHLILIWMQLGDVFTLVSRLQAYGYSLTEAMELKGVFDRGQPLIQFGIVFGSSFALALIPNVVLQRKEKEVHSLSDTVQEAVMICTYIATAASVGLIVLFPEVNTLLFKTDVETTSLRILMLAIILSSYVIIVSTLLQNIGLVNVTALFIVGSVLCKVSLNYLLVPLYGISGASLATIFSLLFLATCVTFTLKRTLYDVALFQLVKWRPFMLALAAMSGFLLFTKWVVSMLFPVQSRLFLLCSVSFFIVSGALIYGAVLLRYGALTRKQLSYFPFATKLVYIESKLRKNV